MHPIAYSEPAWPHPPHAGPAPTLQVLRARTWLERVVDFVLHRQPDVVFTVNARGCHVSPHEETLWQFISDFDVYETPSPLGLRVTVALWQAEPEPGDAVYGLERLNFPLPAGAHLPGAASSVLCEQLTAEISRRLGRAPLAPR